MSSSTSIPIIVQGNSFSLAIPLQIYVISEGSMVLQDYTPDPTDQVSIQLKGSRRQYTYAPTVTGNTAFIDLSGNEMADNYGVVVSIVKENGQRLRSFRTDQFFIVESSDDLTPDDIIQGLEENVIYLNSSIFVAGEQGEQGEPGVGISSIAKTATSGLVDTYTITLTNGNTYTFTVTNGEDGHDLGLASIINNLKSDSTEDALSAAMGKELGERTIVRRTFVNAAICAVGGYYNYQTSAVVASTDARYCLIPIEGIERLDVTGCYQKAVHYFAADGTTKVGRTTTEVLTKADFPSGAVYCGWAYNGKNVFVNVSIDYIVDDVLANVGVSNMTDEKVIVPLIRKNVDSTTGEVIDGDSWLITPNLIPLCNAYGAYFEEGSNANICFCYWYDKNKEFIKNTTSTKGDKAPEGACYMRFRVGGYTQGYTQATLHLYGSSITPQKIDDMELATTNISPRNLLNKKVAFLGDSITAQNAYCSYFGLISGAIISDLGVNGKCYSGGEIALQAANLVGNEEVVVMMGGTNDFSQAKAIGNIYDVSNGTITPTADTTTFCGGLHKAINDIYTKCPTVQIVIITPPQKSNGWTANSAGKYLYDYADAVKEVAKLYAIPVVDQFANCGINPVLAPMKTKYFSNDGTHPNVTYHWLLARWLYTALATWVKEHHV